VLGRKLLLSLLLVATVIPKFSLRSLRKRIGSGDHIVD
jgi:hypothetical protein